MNGRNRSDADIERGFRLQKSAIDIETLHHRLPDRIGCFACRGRPGYEARRDFCTYIEGFKSKLILIFHLN